MGFEDRRFGHRRSEARGSGLEVWRFEGLRAKVSNVRGPKVLSFKGQMSGGLGVDSLEVPGSMFCRSRGLKVWGLEVLGLEVRRVEGLKA